MEQNQNTAESIYDTVTRLYGPDDLVEVRILDTEDLGNRSGYFFDKEKLAEAAARWNGEGKIYTVLNPVNPALAETARALDKLKAARTTTNNTDIPHRRYLFIDCDPVRPPGLTGHSASDAEHDAALVKAEEIKEWLMKEQGFPDMFMADSGNGGHLVVPVDLPNDKPTAEMLRGFLKGLAERFDTGLVKVDLKVHNAARLIKLWGTLSIKGPNVPDRPHRPSYLIYAPQPGS